MGGLLPGDCIVVVGGGRSARLGIVAEVVVVVFGFGVVVFCRDEGGAVEEAGERLLLAVFECVGDRRCRLLVWMLRV